MITNRLITLAEKSEKKSILRFYKSQQYSARFIGLDKCYLVKNDGNIIASVIISKIHPDNQQYFLHALVVDKHFRQQGIAHELLAKVMANYRPMVCFCQSSLRFFYQECGWQLVSLTQLDRQLTEYISIRFHRYQKNGAELEVFLHQ